MYRFQIPPNGFNHINCHAVARLLICLCIGGNGKKPINLIFRKALQPQALSGHQAANPPATCNDSLAARSVQRIRFAAIDSLHYPLGLRSLQRSTNPVHIAENKNIDFMISNADM